MATTAITELTPMRIPSTVRKERSLLARSDCRAMRDGLGEGHRLSSSRWCRSRSGRRGCGGSGGRGRRCRRSWVTSTMVLPSLVQPLEEPHDLLAGLGVEVAGGLVGQQDRGLHDQGAGDGHALALAAGELVGPVGHAGAQVHHLQGALGHPQPLLLGHPGVDEGQLDVVQGGGPGQQVEGLEDEADLAVADRGQLVVVHLRDHLAPQHVGAAAGRVQAAHDVHEGRLAGAGRPHDRDVLALLDRRSSPRAGRGSPPRP